MDAERRRNLRSRADAKLRYARVHLDELKELDSVGGDDFDRAHQEAFLYHLMGSKDAFIRELNEYYDCGLSQNELTAGKLKSQLDKKGERSDELAELYGLERDPDGWLHHAKEMRDHSTHVSGVSRRFHSGGPADGKVWLKIPRTGDFVEEHFIDAFDEWLSNMEALLERLRASAIAQNSL